MTVLALDWNATRVRAVLGRAGDYPLPVPLEPPGLELPLALGLDRATPEVGGAALRHCRTAPHLVCQAFLPHLAEPGVAGPRWQAGRVTLDARTACDLVWRKLHHLGSNTQGIVLTLPSYLHTPQADTLRKLGEKMRLPVLGSAPTILAAALAGHGEQSWQRSVLVIDVDDHALTMGWVKSLTEKVHLVDCRSFPSLGLRPWRERLIDGLAELFVWHHRRDPRDAPQAEQSLYDQLEPLLDVTGKHQAIQLGVQGQQWFKHLLVHPEQTIQFCQGLARQAAGEAERMLLCWPASELPASILLTHQAGRLPGLVELLQSLIVASSSAETKLPGTKVTGYLDEDFGEALMFPEPEERGSVLVLPAEAPARAVHGLAELFRQGTLPAGHVESIVPLTAPPPVEAGPARVHFQGRDYLLGGASFLIGSHFGCQLHFDRSEHPEVSPRHCEIACDPRGFTLHNRCREGTLVNDLLVGVPVPLRAGDRIRLGPRGPLLRFLGNAASRPSGVRGPWSVVSG